MVIERAPCAHPGTLACAPAVKYRKLSLLHVGRNERGHVQQWPCRRALFHYFSLTGATVSSPCTSIAASSKPGGPNLPRALRLKP